MTGASGRVVVIGGGLAGITAALNLAEAGVPVVLLEARPWLGGATWSFGRRGLTIDNGQHVFLRCFTMYRELLARLGVTEAAWLQDRLDVTVLAPHGPVRLRRSAWPAPAHLATMLARYRPLTPSQRLGVLPAAMTMWMSDLAASGTEQASIGGWLGRHGQDELTISQFWELFLLPFMNAPAGRTDQGTAAAFINAALLSHRDRADLGTAAVPLRDLHGGPAIRRLAQVGAEVRLSAQVAAIRRAGRGGFVVQLEPGRTPAGEVPGQLTLGEEAQREIEAAGVVLAVPAWTAAGLLPADLAPDAAPWACLKPVPIVSVHAIYDRPVMELPFAAAIGSPLRWITDKTRAAGLHTGQYLAASVPAAWGLVDETPAAIRTRMLPELTRLFPAAADARVEDFFITRERRATFLPAPGTRTVRPAQQTRLRGLVLAGAWTDTGWPDTMEGAVRSGHLAAEVILTARAAGQRAGARPMASTAARPVLDGEGSPAGPGPARAARPVRGERSRAGRPKPAERADSAQPGPGERVDSARPGLGERVDSTRHGPGERADSARRRPGRRVDASVAARPGAPSPADAPSQGELAAHAAAAKAADAADEAAAAVPSEPAPLAKAEAEAASAPAPAVGPDAAPSPEPAVAQAVVEELAEAVADAVPESAPAVEQAAVDTTSESAPAVGQAGVEPAVVDTTSESAPAVGQAGVEPAAGPKSVVITESAVVVESATSVVRAESAIVVESAGAVEVLADSEPQSEPAADAATAGAVTAEDVAAGDVTAADVTAGEPTPKEPATPAAGESAAAEEAHPAPNNPVVGRALAAVPGPDSTAQARPAATVPAQRARRKKRRLPATADEADVVPERSQSAASP